MKKWFSVIPMLLFILLLPLNVQAANVLQEIKGIVKSEYYGEIKGNIDQATTIDEAINMLDPYSSYFTQEEYDSFMNTVNMKQVGIGVVMLQHEKGMLITYVIEDGSAFEQGLEAGDIITKVDSVSLQGKTVEEGQALLLGKENTKVTVQVLKADGSTVTKTLTRKPFSIPNTASRLLYGNVGYIQLQSFSENAAELVKKEYDKLKKQGATSFILDLQNNGGGYVDAAEDLIGLFQNTEYAYKVKYSKVNTQYYLYYDRERNKYQLASDGSLLVKLVGPQRIFDNHTKVLVNRYSASASEMTVASLKDYQAAVIYGEKTYGKGTMQAFYELSDNGVLKLTIGEFFGPNGTVIRNTGITPDIITKSDPLYQAHYDAIAEKLANYKEMKALTNVPTTKTFTITLNRQLGPVNGNDVELVELGGNKVDVSLSTKGNQLIVTPNQPLSAGSEYMLLVHPTLKDKQNNPLKEGAYLRVTVRNN
ncbi:S41 family peptidase [Ureibacillus sp. FSL W7-1570]|uniref:S41 family peptidase n=1 Tax=Ureibacillus sp. FSL W7-1570 TaxID=2954593 RepID=UPI00315A7EFF